MAQLSGALFERVVEIIQYPIVGRSVIPHWDWHAQAGVQVDIANHCLDRYYNTSLMLAFYDVDEFPFPCNMSLWPASEPLLPSAFRASTTPDRPYKHLLCYKFGLGVVDAPKRNDELVLEKYTRRAPYKINGEPEEEEQRARPDCAKVFGKDHPYCESLGGNDEKYLYRSEAYPHIRGHLGVHGAGSYTVPGQHPARTSHEICCNHYYMRSTKDMIEKTRKNAYGYYASVVNSSETLEFFNLIDDHLIWQYIPRLKELLTSL